MIPLAILLYLELAIFGDTSAPTDVSPTSIIDYLSNASGPALMAVIIIGAWREWWVPGTVHRRTVDERDQLLELALRSQEVGTKALDTAERGIRRR